MCEKKFKYNGSNTEPLQYGVKPEKKIKFIAWRLINGKKRDVKTYITFKSFVENINEVKEQFKKELRKANIVFDGVDVVRI